MQQPKGFKEPHKSTVIVEVVIIQLESLLDSEIRLASCLGSKGPWRLGGPICHLKHWEAVREIREKSNGILSSGSSDIWHALVI